MPWWFPLVGLLFGAWGLWSRPWQTPIVPPDDTPWGAAVRRRDRFTSFGVLFLGGFFLVISLLVAAGVVRRPPPVPDRYALVVTNRCGPGLEVGFLTGRAQFPAETEPLPVGRMRLESPGRGSARPGDDVLMVIATIVPPPVDIGGSKLVSETKSTTVPVSELAFHRGEGVEVANVVLSGIRCP